MSVSILEVLQNANINIDNVGKLGIGFLPIVKEQLNNAVVLLEKGYSIDDDFNSIIDKHGSVENAPEKLHL